MTIFRDSPPRRRRASAPAALAAALAIVALPACRSEESAGRFELPPHGFEAGQAFPDISLPALEDGRPVRLSEFRGQKILLHVFASW